MQDNIRKPKKHLYSVSAERAKTASVGHRLRLVGWPHFVAERKNEISCAKVAELRDNNFNIGGLATWHGIGRMDGKDQLEAEAIAAVSGPEYFALQKLVNRP